MEVKVVSTKLVKPQTPTPESLKTYKISYMDELNPTMNVVAIFYYQSPAATTANLHRLQESLSEILPSFYPFAGRYIKRDQAVDCSDQGALVIDATVDLPLQEITKLEAEKLNDLLPCETGAADEEDDPILSVQFNRLKCGGAAVSISISHRIIDACSMGTFVQAWTNAALGGNREAICPDFDGPVFFPGKNFPAPEFGTTRARENGLYNIICKKFLFDKDTISALKARVGRASRVGVVSGLVVKAMSDIDRARALVVAQAVNVRGRTVPSLSKHSCGNLVHLSITECSAEETEKMEVEDYVRVLGSDARKTVGECAGLLSEDGHKAWIETSHDASDKSLRTDLNVLWVTDWTKFGFYGADFGWGKPAWVSSVNMAVKNHFQLMDTKEGDGIEAWVQLEEAEMPLFENEITKFVSAAA